MNFDFSAEQYALRDVARELFEKESPPSRLRALWEGVERDPKVWKTMAEVGLLGITVPEEHGGLGGDEVDLVLVLEEAGRAALPEPLLETVAIGAPALAGTNPEWLPRIASGDAIVTVALGTAPFVVDADLADLLVVERNGELHAVPRELVRARLVPSEDRARRLFAVEATTSRETLMPGGLGRAPERARVATAALLNGIGMRLLEMTLEHVKARHQFGRPVGSFQAVKHKLANVHVALSSARAATWYAAYAIARELPDASRASRVAKACAAEAEACANAEALQCHGGIGFTWEHDLHLWLKRGMALEPAHGSAAEHRAALAAELFAEDTHA